MSREKNSEFVITKSTKNIVPVACILAITVVAVIYIIFSYLKTVNTIDKFTYCMQTTMNEHTKAGKFLEAKDAREICKSLEK
jgi:hypothetical protein